MYKLAINRPISILMLFSALIIFGFLSLFSMNVNLFPNVSIPLIKISTKAAGDLSFVESKITKEIENAVSEIDGVKTINSVSYDNFSLVMVEFKLDKNLEVAANDVRDKIAALGLEARPTIEKVSSDSGTTLSIFLSAEDKRHLMQAVRDEIVPFLQRVDGVGKIESVGFQRPQVKIALHPNLLRKYQLNALEVAKIIKEQNFKQALGELENPQENHIIKGYFEATSLEELAHLRLGPGIFLSDVATLSHLYEDAKQAAIFEGKEGVLLQLAKVDGSNSLAMIEGVKKALPDLEKSFPEVDFSILYDKGLNIHKHLSSVLIDMLIGVLLTLVIVFFFLRNLSATLIACVAIPSSIIATFFIIDLLGQDLNRLSFIALTLSIGIFIDDAIVVIENIAKKLATHPPLEAAFLGIREIGFSVLSISVVLLCVFVPISYMHSIPGLFFKALGLSVASGIVVSFLVSVLLIPSLAARFLRPNGGKFFHQSEALFAKMDDFYERILRKILRNKGKFILSSLALIAFCFFLAGRIGLDFLPMEDDSEIQILIQSKKDLSLEAMRGKTLPLLEKIQNDPNVAHTFLLVGYDDARDATRAKIYVKLKPLGERRLRQKELIGLYRQNLAADGLELKILELPKIEGAGVDDPVQILLLGDDLRELENGARRAREILARKEGVVDISDNAQLKKAELSLRINREKAKRLDVSPQYVAGVLQHSFGEVVVGSMDGAGGRDDLVLSLAPEFKRDIEALKRISIKNNQGLNLELSSVVDFVYGEDLKSIHRYNKSRSVKITAAVNGPSLDAVQRLILENKTELLGEGLGLAFTGFINLLDETLQGFIFAIILGLTLIYLVLAALYESFILPLIIMISMPLAFGGACVGLFLTGHNFSLFVLIAIILLFGMVGKNAILLVDVANKKCLAGMDADLALVEAGRLRLRAILMTSLAMIFAMLPLALSRGAGYEANAPMAITIIFGLISSTLLTLLIVPALFKFCFGLDSGLRKIYQRKRLD